MALRHQLPKLNGVAGKHRRPGFKHAVVFRDDVPTTTVGLRRHSGPGLDELFYRGIAQVADLGEGVA